MFLKCFVLIAYRVLIQTKKQNLKLTLTKLLNTLNKTTTQTCQLSNLIEVFLLRNYRSIWHFSWPTSKENSLKNSTNFSMTLSWLSTIEDPFLTCFSKRSLYTTQIKRVYNCYGGAGGSKIMTAPKITPKCHSISWNQSYKTTLM